MADRPILFSGPMVRALVAGRKTQTRRILNPQPYPLKGRPGFWNASGAVGGRIVGSDGELASLHRYAIGDRLWVRESWCWAARGGHHARDDGGEVWYRASDQGECDGPWKPSIHMSRACSRLTLTVIDVRVERLQDISQTDALAEGIARRRDKTDPVKMTLPEFFIEDLCAGVTARDAYASLWEGLNAKRGFGWPTNPWVVAVTFGVERRNIDAPIEGAA